MTTVALPDVALPTAPRELRYRHEFRHNELDAIKACVDAHGFAIVKKMISQAWVDDIKESMWEAVAPKRDLRPGETRFDVNFIEHSKPFQRMLDHEPYMAIHRALVQCPEVTLHRSAAIMKNIGAPAASWHTDWSGHQGPPGSVDDVLNRGEVPAGAWFYLNGTHPARGGLAIIEDSHRPDWPGPEGFEFTPYRKSFYPRGTPVREYTGMDVPGVLPLFTDPGDLILFASRTYHGVYPHQGTEPRLSCACNFRPGRHGINAPWHLSKKARAFIDSQPPHVRPVVEYYSGLESGWNAERSACEKAS